MSATFRACIIAFVLSLGCAIDCYLAAGATLGLLIGPPAFSALIGPPLALAVSQRSQRLLVALTLTSSIVIWLIAFQILTVVTCAVILITFCIALVAIAHATRSTAIPTLLALAWLSFPIWLRGEVAASLVPFHPIFAMNSVAPSLGIWTQQPILYRLTTLGQDVPFSLPASIFPCAIAHAVIGLLLLLPSKPASDGLSDRQTTPTPPPAPQELRTP